MKLEKSNGPIQLQGQQLHEENNGILRACKLGRTKREQQVCMHGDKKRKKMCCEKKRDEEGEGRKVKRKRIQYHKPEKKSFLCHPTLKTEMEPEGGEEWRAFLQRSTNAPRVTFTHNKMRWIYLN